MEDASKNQGPVSSSGAAAETRGSGPLVRQSAAWGTGLGMWELRTGLPLSQNQVTKRLELPAGRGQAPAQSKVGRARVRGPELLAAQVRAGVPPPSVAR